MYRPFHFATSCRIDIHIYKNDQHVQTLNGHTDMIKSIIQLHDGRLASGSYDTTIRIWDLQKRTSEVIQTGDLVDGIVELNNGRIAAWFHHDSYVKVWDIHTKAFYAESIYRDLVAKVILLRNGCLASCCDDGTIHLWNVDTRKRRTLTIPKAPCVHQIMELPDGRIVASASRHLYIWNQVDDELTWVWKFPAQFVNDKIAQQDPRIVEFRHGQFAIYDHDDYYIFFSNLSFNFITKQDLNMYVFHTPIGFADIQVFHSTTICELRMQSDDKEWVEQLYSLGHFPRELWAIVVEY